MHRFVWLAGLASRAWKAAKLSARASGQRDIESHFNDVTEAVYIQATILRMSYHVY